MYRTAAEYEMRCPRGISTRMMMLKGCYCTIPPCRGILDMRGTYISKFMPAPVAGQRGEVLHE